MKLTLGIFSGAIRALHPKLVPDAAGVDSQNQKPGRGDFRPWRSAFPVATVPASRQTIYRMGRDVRSDASYWLSWPSRVHVMRGYDNSDTTERTYYTGDGVPKWVDNTFALAGGGPYPVATRLLGVPAPATKATLTANNVGVSSNTESRYVVYTYVNTKNDESAPSPKSLELVCKDDDTMTASALAAAPGGYDIDRIRIYATVTGKSGETEFFFQKEVVASTTSTTITAILASEVLETDGWLMPPADLKCLTPMWNGMAAAISGRGVRVCETNAIYAWPIGYEFVPPDVTPVGLGRWGEQNLLVLTTGIPYSLIGTGPGALDLQPAIGQACSSERGIVGFPHGVVYPCEDGLAYFNAGVPKLLTAGIFTRDDWQAMNPTTMVAGIYEGAYLCFFTQDSVRRGFLLDPLNPQGAFFLTDGYDAAWFDQLQDALFVLSTAGSVQKWDAGLAPMTATYRSKLWVTPATNLRWAKVTADAYPVTLLVDAGPFTAGEQTNMAGLLADHPASSPSWAITCAPRTPSPATTLSSCIRGSRPPSGRCSCKRSTP
jgi:hypothetical protein